MKITFIGKNDTYRSMLSWKEILPDNIDYFMTHPRIGFTDKSTFNSYIYDKLDNSDINFIHIALRDRGYAVPLQFLSVDFNKYKNKTIIYLCGDCSIDKINKYRHIYSDYNYLISNNPKVSTILDIPYVPAPTDFSFIKPRSYSKPTKINGMTIKQIAGQQDKNNQEIEDFINLSEYLIKKFHNYKYEVQGSSSFKVIYNEFFKRCNIYFDTYNMFNLETLITCWSGIATISNLSYEYIMPFINFTKTWTLPFINVCNLSEFKIAMDDFLRNPEFIISEGKRARLWMENFWNKEKHINNLNNIIKEFNL